MPDVLIVGAGVVGLSVAWNLAKKGCRTLVLDQSKPGNEASWAGAGMLPPGNREYAVTPEAKLRSESALLWPGLSAEIRDLTGIDNGFRRCGGLQFLGDAWEAEIDVWRKEHVEIELLDRTGIHALEPEASQEFDRAYFLPGLSQVRNPWHLRGLQTALIQKGGEVRPYTAVRGFQFSGGKVVGVKTDLGQLHADQIVITAGAWTGQLGLPISMRPVRGQIVLLAQNRGRLGYVVQLGPRYVVPRGDGHVLVGSTEEDVGFEKRNTAEGISGLLSFASRLVPVLGEATFVKAWSGFRPRGVDDLPYLGQIPGYENLWIAAGHYRAGLQMSPITGQIVAKLICGEPVGLSLDPFRVDRGTVCAPSS